MTLELLYFEGCPSWQHALDQLRASVGKAATIHMIRVETQAEAEQQRFTGSPTIRVDGADLFPPSHNDFALGCRIYHTSEGMRGWPTAAMIQDALAVHP